MRTAAAVAIGGQLALLAALTVTTGLGFPALVVGVACTLATNIALTRGLARAGADELGPANRITLLRATLVGGIAALVTDALVHGTRATVALVVLASVALALDAVDGYVARRTASVTPLGARFDGEVDAFLILVLSVAAVGSVGAWVLVIGVARYAFGLAGWWVPWLRAPLPARYWRKTVAAVQGVVLTVAVAGILPTTVTTAAYVIALALLSESFGRDILWLAKRRHQAVVARIVIPQWLRRLASGAVTVGASSLLWFALVGPNRTDALHPGAFIRLPIEGLVIAGLALALPTRSRRAVGVVAGLALGALTIVKILDMGFYEVLARPFNPVDDWSTFGPAIGVLGDSIGSGWAVVAAIGAGVAVAAILVLLPLSTVRVMGIAAQHRPASMRAVGVLGVAWFVCAGLGIQGQSGAPVASTSAAGLAYDQVRAVRAALHDRQTFEAQLHANDSFANLPGSDLLTGLRGKDVIVAVVESYGQVAVQGTTFSPQVDSVLKAGTRTLETAGFGARSAFLTSPTFGGISWLAHSTLQSGLWIDSQQRYDQLIGSGRFTLSDAFKRAGWRTVVDIPSSPSPWPDGERLYRFDKMYGTGDVGYQGPSFNYAQIPDEYTLKTFYQRELQPKVRRPVMAEIDLVSSHEPWAPLPHMVGWNQVGDGSVYDRMPAQGQKAHLILPHPSLVQAAYGRSVQYSLQSLISFVQNIHDNNLVLIMYGDHQPASIVSGPTANHRVPITVIAHDPKVLGRIASWGWQAGMLPNAAAPVWPMSSFRDRFLRAYDPQVVTAAPH